MPQALLLSLLLFGALGLFLTLPRARTSLAPAGLLMLLIAGGCGLALLLMTLPGERSAPIGFALLALVGFYGGVRVITHSRPVYSALHFILVVFSVWGLLLGLEASFLAFSLLIIYAGAILVTYVFVIMLAQQSGGSAWYDREAREPALGVLAGVLLMGVVLSGLAGAELGSGPPARTAAESMGNFVAAGTLLMTEYVVGVQVAGVLLLAAMVGAIAIARRRADEAHFEEPD